MTLAATFSCRSRLDTGKVRHNVPPDTAQHLDSARRSWREMNIQGDFPGILAGTRRFYREARLRRDTLSALYAGSFLAQAHLFQENTDSVGYYLNEIAEWEESCRDGSARAVYANVAGCYVLKSELDYPKALSHFHRGLQAAEESGDTDNQVALLSNISNIFYTLGDSSGIQFAEKAYAIAQQDNVNPGAACQANIIMAQMLLLSGRIEAMPAYLRRADSLIHTVGIPSLSTVFSIVNGAYLARTGSDRLADLAYREGMDGIALAEPSIASFFFLNFGDFCLQKGRTAEAEKLYLNGLRISYRNRNHEFRPDLLLRLYDLYRQCGRKRLAEEYLLRHRSFLDSLALYRKEQEFKNLLFSYQRIEHENELQAKELALLKAHRKSGRIASVLLLVSLVLTFVLILFRKQRRMYRILVRQHQSYLQRLESPAAETPAASDPEKTLFERIETLMKKERVYRQKDLSLDKMAELLGTNRTYVSKAINRFARMTFYNYLDLYRIREATEILSRPEEDIPFKQLSDRLGYNSVSVFYKAFRRETGCTPGRYREEIRHLEQPESIENA